MQNKKWGGESRPVDVMKQELFQRASTCLLYKEGPSSASGAGSVFIVWIHNQGFTVEADVRSKVFSQIARSRRAVKSLVADGPYVHDGRGGYLSYGWNGRGCIQRLGIENLPLRRGAVGIGIAGAPKGDIDSTRSSGGDPWPHRGLTACAIIHPDRGGPCATLICRCREEHVGPIAEHHEDVAGLSTATIGKIFARLVPVGAAKTCFTIQVLPPSEERASQTILS